MTFKKSGVNLSWEKNRKYMHYGYSIGRADQNKAYHVGFSNPESKKKLEKAFDELSRKGIKTVRVFLFCDFRAGVHFHKKKYPYFDEKVYEDSYVLMESARTYKIELIPVLLDFHIANRWLFNYFDPFDHPEVLRDDEIRNELEHLFGQYIEHYSSLYADVIQAWDLFNEPEWAWAISLRTIIPHNDPRARYIKEMYDIGRKNSHGIPITVGWDKKENAVRFIEFTDMLQAHCYNQNFSKFLDYLSQRNGGKKILVGEVGARNLTHMDEILKIAREKDVEILFWDSYHPDSPKIYIFEYNKFEAYLAYSPG